MTHSLKAQGAGQAASTNDEGPTVPAVAPQANTKDSSPDSRRTGHVTQALEVISGERTARDYLTRLHSQQADPDELAATVIGLSGAARLGFCRTLEKAIQGGAT